MKYLAETKPLRQKPWPRKNDIFPKAPLFAEEKNVCGGILGHEKLIISQRHLLGPTESAYGRISVHRK